MNYLHVSLTGLRGRHHPALANIITTTQVQKSRIHLKMLTGDYLTYEIRAEQSGGSPHCRCCLPSSSSSPSSSPAENLEHILSKCSAYSDVRNRMYIQYKNLCSNSRTKLEFDNVFNNDKLFCQFVLDPSSFNLIERIHLCDPVLNDLFQLSRDYCHAVNSARMRILKSKQAETQLKTIHTM